MTLLLLIKTYICPVLYKLQSALISYVETSPGNTEGARQTLVTPLYRKRNKGSEMFTGSGSNGKKACLDSDLGVSP